MLKNTVIPAAIAAIALATSAGAFAAGSNIQQKNPAGTQQVAELTKQQVSDIEKQCHADHKHDKAAYKACVAEKKKAAGAGEEKKM